MRPFLAMIMPIDGGHVDNSLPLPGRPVDPGYGVEAPPPGIWPSPGHPAHPIAPGGPPPGIWPSPGRPAHPIAPGGPPGTVSPPIYYPPSVDNTLPGSPPTVDNSLPLPPGTPSHPIVTPPGVPPMVIVGIPGIGWVAYPVTGRPDNSLPPTTPQPKAR